MNFVDKSKVGFAFGAFFGLFHAVWAILVWIGWAQPLINWIFGLHFIQPPYTIGEFYPGTAIFLVVVTTVVGYILGWVLAACWNWFHKN